MIAQRNSYAGGSGTNAGLHYLYLQKIQNANLLRILLMSNEIGRGRFHILHGRARQPLDADFFALSKSKH
jgi:hypothetical protein